MGRKNKNVIYPLNFFNQNLYTEEEISSPVFPREDDKIYYNTYQGNDRNLKTEDDQLLSPTQRILPTQHESTQKFLRKSAVRMHTLKPKEIDYGSLFDEFHQGVSEKGHYSRFYFEKLMLQDYAIMIFAIQNLAFSVFYYECDFQDKNPQAAEVLLWFLLFFSILEKYTFTMINFRYEFEFQFKYNWLLTIGGWIKIYIIARVILKSTTYMSTRAVRISRMYGCSANYQYAFKCLFRDFPISLSIFLFVVSISVFGYCLLICEQPMVYILSPHQSTFLFDTYQSSIWCTIITITTIGYGDFIPQTALGRLIIVILTIWGAFIVSLMVVVLSNALEMDLPEKRSLLLLKRMQTRSSLKSKAASLLSQMIKYKNIEKTANKEYKKLEKNYYIQKALALKQNAQSFRNQSREMKNLKEQDNIAEEMYREFDFVRDDVYHILEKMKKLSKYIEDNLNVI